MTGEEMTTIDRFLTDGEDSSVQLMMELPDYYNMKIVRKRREHLFSKMWETFSFGKHEVLSHVKDREEDFLEMDMVQDEGENIPEWMLRMEAQDILVKNIIDKLTGE